MIQFEGTKKVTANQFAKLFIMSSVEKIISSMDEIFDGNPEWYSKLTDNEKADIKEQLRKRADGMKNYYGIDEI